MKKTTNYYLTENCRRISEAARKKIKKRKSGGDFVLDRVFRKVREFKLGTCNRRGNYRYFVIVSTLTTFLLLFFPSTHILINLESILDEKRSSEIYVIFVFNAIENKRYITT